MVEVAPAPTKAAKKKRVNKPRTGPGLSDRIVAVVSASNERGGVSGSAIKKALIAGGYDVERNNGRVKLALRNLVLRGTLIQARESGASGSFKISKKPAEPRAKRGTNKTVKTVRAKKPATQTKKPAAKKPLKKAKKPAARKTTKTPKTGTRSPKTGTKTPKTGTRSPKTGTRSPKTGTKTPKTGTRSPKIPKKVSKKTSAAKKSPVKRVSKPKTTKAALKNRICKA